ncbi:phosphatase and actin regulator 4B isoform X3 [Homalodisca vitripennis]|uniref:phosphatase and actin regulator 4B isoform X3 n=1 Tax=Homalodisca vitripennis TaxID=197043 RepID=UPI001EEB304D|nr:phosphatase and actin regulator 4B isoform X3 [Homalodisca vitripennis]
MKMADSSENGDNSQDLKSGSDSLPTNIASKPGNEGANGGEATAAANSSLPPTTESASTNCCNGDIGKKQNGSALRTNSLGSGTRTPPLERKSKFSALGRLFKPWKWKRKKKSEKFEAASRSLERKISVRAPRDELVQKGILLLESPTSPLPLPGPEGGPPFPTAGQTTTPSQFRPPPLASPVTNIPELKKDKCELVGSGGVGVGVNGGCVSPSGEPPPAPSLAPPDSKPERPSSLGPGKLTRRLLCYHNDHYTSSPTRPHPDSQVHEGGSPRLCTPPPGPGPEPPLTLSELPEPPIPVSEIGPIPPPPMFSSQPSGMPLGIGLHSAVPLDLSAINYGHDEGEEEEEYLDDSPCEDEDEEDGLGVRVTRPDPAIDTSRVEEIPAKEPKFHAVPLKSALKKPPTPTQDGPGPLKRQPLRPRIRICSRPVRFGIALPCTLEDKENTRPYGDDAESDSSGDGPVLYRDDDDNDSTYGRLAAKIARKDSLALKLALRPDRQELIDRNILQLQSEKERQENKEAVGARLIRRLSMRPTQEELEDRNILKKQSAAEEKKLKEEKKRMLLRKLSFRPTVEELKEKKIIRFNDYIEVTQAHDYDRRADKPWTRLTPKDKAAIRKELNEFKSSEMEVHQESRHLTRFHRP